MDKVYRISFYLEVEMGARDVMDAIHKVENSLGIQLTLEGSGRSGSQPLAREGDVRQFRTLTSYRVDDLVGFQKK